ncbi:hypothetical protein [Streptomyces sp. NPDC055261]
MTKTCRVCDMDTDEPTAVALEHTNSCGGRVVHLCPPCRAEQGLIPLDQHPEGSDGFPLHEVSAP